MVGGKDMKTRIAEEMLSYRKPQRKVTSVPSTSVQTELVTKVVSSVSAVKSTPAKQVEPEFAMPSSGGILSQLSSLDNSEDEWEMVGMSEELVIPISSIEPELVNNSTVQEELEVGTVNKERSNPFASAPVSAPVSSDELEVGTVNKKRNNPFA